MNNAGSTINMNAYRGTKYYKQADRSNARVLNIKNQSNSAIPLQDGSDGLLQIKRSPNGFEHRVKISPGGSYTETYSNGELVLKSSRQGGKLTTEWIGGNGKVVTKREVRSGSNVITTTFDEMGKQTSSLITKR